MHAAARLPGAVDANECLSPLSGSDKEREGGGGNGDKDSSLYSRRTQSNVSSGILSHT